MTGAAAVAPARLWNTWDSDHPAAMRFLPLGLELRPCVYAASRNQFTDFPATQAGLTLGARGVTAAEGVHLGLAHAGTELDLGYGSPEPSALTGHYRVCRHGEWGLRFWVLLVLRLLPPERRGAALRWRFDAERGMATVSHRGSHVAVGASRPPLLVTVHGTLAALKQELESKGYWYLDSRGTAGPVMALRYNLEEMPELSFAAVVAESAEAAADKARAALSPPTLTLPLKGGGESEVRPPPPSPLGMEGEEERAASAAAASRANEKGGPAQFQSPPPLRGRDRVGGTAHTAAAEEDPRYAAVRDVIAWNTVWDPVNHRPYTALSRNWGAQKFGGWGVWLDDLFFHALMASIVDADLARENLAAALGNATPYGNLACLITGRDAWVDRSQPPIGSLVAWLLHRRLGDEALLRTAYAALAANHAWWLMRRDGNGDGLYEYGSSNVGSGLYVGTKLAAKDESFMDNSPVHDEAVFDAKTRTLDSADVGLNSLIALDAEMLARIAAALGENAGASRHNATAQSLRPRIAEGLWDEERQCFANRLWSGKFVRSIAPTSFFPLLAGAASPEQARAMVRLLQDPAKFGGEWLLPSVTRDDPAFHDNVYWRGRIWPPLNFLVWLGLKRAGFAADAAALAENGWRLFQRAWVTRKCPENFSAVTGEAFDQPDTDTFYGWGALMPFIALANDAADMIDLGPL